ncbi:MAG: ABC transporter permease subunit [Dehalococcoidales bacterium]|nr:MAG: ABC transporter permease subunit [Dehalococcoidales bacterium]
MRAYIIRRIFLIIPTLFLVTIIVFLTVRLIPGDLIDQLAGEMIEPGGLTKEEIADQIRRDLGLDKPMPIQYLVWLGVLPQNEWGFKTESSVSDLTVKRQESDIGVTDTVKATVTNVGETRSDYEVSLMSNGTTLEAKRIALDIGASELVTFVVSGNTDGTYTVDASGYSDFSGIFQGNLGESLRTERPILGEIISKIPISLELGIIAILTGLLIAFPIGIYSAIRQDSFGDYTGRTIAILFMAVPPFWLATMIWVFPSKWWGWSPDAFYIPLFGEGSNFIGNIRQFIIPGVLMGMVMSGVTMRMTRTMMLEVLRQDYIRTAWSKGLRERVVVLRHALKNAMIPVITIIGLQLPVLIGGTVIMEQIFNLPGMGRYMIDSLGARDYTIISGINVMMASVILLANLLVDLTYAWLDPRIRYR